MKAHSIPAGIRGYNEKHRKGTRVVCFNPNSRYPFIFRYLHPKSAYAKPFSERQSAVRETFGFLSRIFYHIICPLLCRREGDLPNVATYRMPAPARNELAGRFIRSNFFRLLVGFDSIATKIPDEGETPDEPTIKKVEIKRETTSFFSRATARKPAHINASSSPYTPTSTT